METALARLTLAQQAANGRACLPAQEHFGLQRILDGALRNEDWITVSAIRHLAPDLRASAQTARDALTILLLTCPEQWQERFSEIVALARREDVEGVVADSLRCSLRPIADRGYAPGQDSKIFADHGFTLNTDVVNNEYVKILSHPLSEDEKLRRLSNVFEVTNIPPAKYLLAEFIMNYPHLTAETAANLTHQRPKTSREIFAWRENLLKEGYATRIDRARAALPEQDNTLYRPGLSIEQLQRCYDALAKKYDFAQLDRSNDGNITRSISAKLFFDLWDKSGVAPLLSFEAQTKVRFKYLRGLYSSTPVRDLELEALAGIPPVRDAATLEALLFIKPRKQPSGDKTLLTPALASEAIMLEFQELAAHEPPNVRVLPFLFELERKLQMLGQHPQLDPSRMEKLFIEICRKDTLRPNELLDLLIAVERFVPATRAMINEAYAATVSCGVRGWLPEDPQDKICQFAKRWGLSEYDGSLTAWEWLINRYGKPSEQSIQFAYQRTLAQIVGGKSRHDGLRALQAIERESGVPLNREAAELWGSACGITVPGESLVTKVVYSLIRTGSLRSWDMDDLERINGRPIKLAADEALILYAQILFGALESIRDSNDIYLYKDEIKEALKIVEKISGEPIASEVKQAFFSRVLKSARWFKVIEVFSELLAEDIAPQTLAQVRLTLLKNSVSNSTWHNSHLWHYISLLKFQGLESLDPDEVHRIFGQGAAGGPEYLESVSQSVKLSGFKASPEFVRKNILANRGFTAFIPAEFSAEDLSTHFSVCAKRTVAEFNRIYQVLAPHSFYEKFLADLRQSANPSTRSAEIAILGAMACACELTSERYCELRREILGYIESGDVRTSRALAEVLSNLANKGDKSVTKLCGDLLMSKDSESPRETKSALDYKVSLGLRALINIKSPDSSWMLIDFALRRDTAPALSRYIVRALIISGAQVLSGSEQKLFWELASTTQEQIEDLKFLRATSKIANADTRAECTALVSRNIEHIGSVVGPTLSSFKRTHAPQITDAAFIPALVLSACRVDLLKKINLLYTRAKSNNERDEFLTALIPVLVSEKSEEYLAQLRSIIENFALDKKGDMADLSRVLRGISFLARVFESLEDKNASVAQTLGGNLSSFDDLISRLESKGLSSLMTILKHSRINEEHLQNIWHAWGELDPIFVLAGRLCSSAHGYRAGLEHLTEIVAHLDPPNYDGWRAWRYDLGNNVVRAQIGSLSDDQRNIWLNDRCIMINPEIVKTLAANSQNNNRTRISEVLNSALRDHHISNSAAGFFPEFEQSALLLTRVLDGLACSIPSRTQVRSEFLREIEAQIGAIHDHKAQSGALLTLKAHRDLCLLATLSEEELAQSTVTGEAGEKRRAVAEIIGNLKQYFKSNTTFCQDLGNILAIMRQENVGLLPQQELAVLITDHPEMLFRIGRYPRGSNSCMNYEGDIAYARALPAYIADAHIKGAFLIDLSKLSESSRLALLKGGAYAAGALKALPQLLEAVVARQVLKIGYTESNDPAIYQERIYPENIESFKYLLDNSVAALAAQAMALPLAREFGSAKIHIPESRNPEGQYEDWHPCQREDNNVGGVMEGKYSIDVQIITPLLPHSELAA